MLMVKGQSIVRLPRWQVQTQHGRTLQKDIRYAFALAVAFMGSMNELAVLLPVRPGRLALLNTILEQLAPFAPSLWPILRIGRTVALILGFFLLVIAFGLVNGKRRAWQCAIVILPLSALAHLIRGLAVEEALFTLLVWISLISSFAFFQVESDPGSFRQGLLLLIFGTLLCIIYIMSGLYLLQAQLLLPQSIGGLARSLLLRLINSPATEIIPLSGQATWFLNSLPWLSTTVLLTGMFFLLRPVSTRWWTMCQRELLAQMNQKAIELVRRYGSHTLSFFALASKNLQYIAGYGEGLIAFQLAGNVAVTLGDPICSSEALERTTQEFLDLCQFNDWHVAFYQAHPEHIPTYRALGLRTFKIGEEAIVNPQSFTLSGSAMANVRTTCRRAEREGVTLQWYDGLPPENVLRQLQTISDSWLAHKGGKHATEMGFSMGRLHELHEASARADTLAGASVSIDSFPVTPAPRLVVGIASDATNHPCAFVTFTPLYGSGNSWGWALDLMRRADNAPPGVMELLLVRAIERFRECGATRVSLGLVAMADTLQEMTPGQRQIASFISEHLRLLETHRSLLRFKQKFQPRWESRYIVTSSTLALPKTALAMLRVHW